MIQGLILIDLVVNRQIISKNQHFLVKSLKRSLLTARYLKNWESKFYIFKSLLITLDLAFIMSCW